MKPTFDRTAHNGVEFSIACRVYDYAGEEDE